MNSIQELKLSTHDRPEEIHTTSLLEVENFSLTIERFEKGLTPKRLYVIRDFYLKIRRGEVVAVVGASGSGKSMLADCIIGLHPKHSRMQGIIRFEEEALTEKRKKQLRGKDIMLIPQMTNALDPLVKVGQQIKTLMKQKNKEQLLETIFQKVGLSPKMMHQLPSTLSGGMIRRIYIAMTLASEAKLIIADEPTNGLDYEALNEMLFLFKMLKNEDRGVIMITHDIDMALKIADKIAVFYAGETVEIASRHHFTKKGEKLRHPYTKALWNALPQNEFVPVEIHQPSSSDEIQGCSFYEHCPKATKKCKMEKPNLHEIGNDEMVRCHYA